MITQSRFKILSPTGFVDFDGIVKSRHSQSVLVMLSDESTLRCSLDHRVLVGQAWKYAKSLRVGDYVSIAEPSVNRRVVSVQLFEGDVELYDIVNVAHPDSAYITNGIVSHNCQFLGSAQTLIDSAKIQCLVAENPIFERNNLRVFEAPKKDHAYYLTVDVSRGRGLDYSAIIVFDVTTFPFKVVATFKDNTISPMELPTLVFNLGMQYNEALVLIEANDLGESVANELWWTLEYPGVLHTKDGKIGGSGILGVKTTKGVKNRGCSKVKELIENDQLIVNDGRIIEELEGYVLGKKGSYEAQNTKINDDLCACLFLFGWSCESDYFRDYANNDVSKTLIDRYKADVEDTIPAIGSFTDGGDDPYESLRLNSDQIEMLR